ncbi:ABC transporter ATP-binding protein [Halobacteriales archaeon QS_3_64_16]|nr:MAG: ABC transporter ATP-binding protein [Halobacteriales archaeon QS_3_64_16]
MQRGGDDAERDEASGAERGGDDGVLVAENVSRHYGETSALDGVSLALEASEVFCCIGPNGAGKTTLVRALCGTTDYEGEVAVFGRAPTAVDRSRVGLLPQEFAPSGRLTARELLTYYAGLYEETRDPEELLTDLGLEGSEETRYENLSGGQRRRVCVGTALVNDPDLLFLDEPTTGIDPVGRRELWRLLEERVASGTTIFLTTHDMAEAERLADRVGLLADGRLAEVGAPGELVGRHGGESRLTIDIEGQSAAGVRALAEAGYRAERREEGLAVADVSPKAINGVVRALDDRGVGIGSLAWRQPTLEDAYLELTGTAVGSGGDPIEAASTPTEIGDEIGEGRSEKSLGAATETDADARTDAAEGGTDSSVDTDAGTGTEAATEADGKTRPGENR